MVNLSPIFAHKSSFLLIEFVDCQCLHMVSRSGSVASIKIFTEVHLASMSVCLASLICVLNFQRVLLSLSYQNGDLLSDRGGRTLFHLCFDNSKMSCPLLICGIEVTDLNTTKICPCPKGLANQ